jgi:dTDP-4-dehydrorhamnose 3,5-epimerase
VKFVATPLAGAYIIEPTALRDERGFFARVFCAEEFSRRGLCPHFTQVNHSMSLHRGTIRGLHYQLPPRAEVKLLRCLRGSVQDVMVDLRRNSPTFLHWHAELLSEQNGKMIYVPEGFAHGFQALEDGAAVTYQSSAPYSPLHERGVRFNDPSLAIAWHVPEAIVSPKDEKWPDLEKDFLGILLEPSERP